MRCELKVNFPVHWTLKEDKCFVLRVHYHLSNPLMGAFFDAFPDATHQFFTFNHSNMARYWMPCFDDVAIRCKWKISLFSKQPLTLVTVGDLLTNVKDSASGLYLMQYLQEVPCSAVDVAVYYGDCSGHTIPNTNIHLFYPKGKVANIFHLEDTVVKCFEFTKWFMNCSYPFKALNVVISRNATVPFDTRSNFISLSSTLLYDARNVEQPFVTKATISLAVCSVYFGGYVFPKTPNDTWLILGLAYYVSRHFCKFLFGTNDYKYQLKVDIESVASIDKGKTPLYNNAVTEIYSLDFLYKKSSLVLHLIEQKIERVPFQKVLNSITIEFGNGDLSTGLSTHHFFKIIRKMTGKDLKATSDQWIFNPGSPVYGCTFTWNRTKNLLELNLKQQSELVNANFYGQLTVRVFESEGVYDHILQVDENSQYFELPIFTKTKKKAKKKKAAEDGTAESQGQPQHQAADEQDEMEIADDATVEDFPVISTPVEWVVVDPELNWIAVFNINNSDFSWSECLDEEKDVVSQHQAIRTLALFPSDSSAMAYTKILSNWKVFFKLRIEAGVGLSVCSTSMLNYVGFGKLVEFFCKKFCFPSSSKIPPGIFPIKPNDFELIQNGFLQKMVCLSISICNQEDNSQIHNQIICLLLSCLLLNDNAENSYSDVDYISGVFYALSLAINKPDLLTVKNHLKNITEEIQRYLFLDKIYRSFHNSLTVAALLLLKKLQFLSYVPIDLDFYIQLLHPNNFIDIRLVAIESVCLFAMRNQDIFKFILNLVKYDNSFNFKLFACKCLREALELEQVQTGDYESNLELKNLVLDLLTSALPCSLKRDLIEIAAIAFVPFSIPELEEEEEEEEEGEEVVAETEQFEPKKELQFPLKLKIGKGKKVEPFVYPLETPEHLLLRVSQHILDRLNNFSDAYIFKYPVDPETPFYYDIIEHPIDLTKISSKKYANIFEFFSDLALLLRNCFSFNDHNSSVALSGKKVKHMLLREIRKVIPAIEQGTVIDILKKETEVSPDTPLIRYSMLQLKGMEASTPFSSELHHIKEKMDANQLKTFDEFRQEVINAITNSSQSDEHINAFSNAFNDFLTAIGKKTASVPSKSRKRVETIVDAVVSKLKYPSTSEADEHNLYQVTNDILLKLFAAESSIWFRVPVDPMLHNAPDYFKVVKHPIDLTTITKKLQSQRYENIHAFEDDMILLFENCYLYNLDGSRVCEDAKSLEKLFVREWTKTKEKLKKQVLGSGSKILIDLESDRLFPVEEKKYHVSLSKNDFDCAVRYIFYRLSTQPFSHPFLYPVSHNVPSYYNIIKNPIAICTMQEKYFNNEYKNIEELENDLELLLKNCYFFNQSSSFVYQMGKKLESFYLGELVKELEQGEFQRFYSWGISSDDLRRGNNLYENLSHFNDLQQLIQLNLLFPFSWNLMAKKLDDLYYCNFSEFDRDVTFWFSFLQETAAEEKSLIESCKQHYTRISQQSTQEERVKIPKIKFVQKKPSSTEVREPAPSKELNNITDISKIPPTPKKHVVIQIKPVKPPQSRMVEYSPPVPTPSFASVEVTDEKAKFLIESFFEKLLKYKFSTPFLQPVDPIALGIPDYASVIKEPMDFGTIYSKWNSGQYGNLGEIARDLGLVTYNCHFYNPPESSIIGNAIKMEDWIKKELDGLKTQILSQQVKWEESDERLVEMRQRLNQLFTLDSSAPFRAPAKFDLVAQQASYKSVIKNPLDLGTIKWRLEHGNFYRNSQQLLEDIDRVFINCFAYYPIQSHEYQQARECQARFESIFAAYLAPAIVTPIPVSQQLVSSFIQLIMQHELAAPFNQPVDYEALGIPKYPDIIRKPMDFQTLLHLNHGEENEFLYNLDLIFKNCCKFNVENSDLWKISMMLSNYCSLAWTIFKECNGSINSIDELNKRIVQSVIMEAMRLPYAEPFIAPVSTELYPNYGKVIKTPMDLQTVYDKIEGSQSVMIKDVVQNIKMIHKNSVKFNGKESELSQAALKLEAFIEHRMSELFFTKRK